MTSGPGRSFPRGPPRLILSTHVAIKGPIQTKSLVVARPVALFSLAVSPTRAPPRRARRAPESHLRWASLTPPTSKQTRLAMVWTTCPARLPRFFPKILVSSSCPRLADPPRLYPLQRGMVTGEANSSSSLLQVMGPRSEHTLMGAKPSNPPPPRGDAASRRGLLRCHMRAATRASRRKRIL